MSARRLRYYKDKRNIDDIEACYQYLLDHAYMLRGELRMIPDYRIPPMENFRKSVLARHSKYRSSLEDLTKKNKE